MIYPNDSSLTNNKETKSWRAKTKFRLNFWRIKDMEHAFALYLLPFKRNTFYKFILLKLVYLSPFPKFKSNCV